MLDTLKKERGCSVCGYNEHACALDFDHLRDKEFNISHDPKRAWNRILEEVEKCQILCANCHRVKTREEDVYYANRDKYRK